MNKYNFIRVIRSASAIGLFCFGGTSAGMPLPPLYYGTDHTQMRLEFEGTVEFDKSRTNANKAIQSQLKYLIGPMQYDTLFDSSYVAAAPRNDHQVTDIRLKKKKKGSSIWIATYQYTGTVVVHKGEGDSVPVRLPMRPGTFPQVGGKACMAPGESPARYWYYWSPLWEDCKIREGIDYKTYEASLTPLENTTLTYPEYSRLWNDERVLEISIFFGIEKSEGTHNPEKINVPEGDPNAWSASQYRSTRNFLLHKSMGFRAIPQWGETWAQENSFLVEKFEKETRRGTIRVHMYYGESGIDKPKVNAFKTLYKNALENHAVVMYHGHSGYGSNLDLSLLAKDVGPIELPKDKYQLIFLDGCSNYAYYTDMYQMPKRTEADPYGTKNLDLLTNGIKGKFSSSDDRNRVILKAIDQWTRTGKATSYQEILDAFKMQFLTGVNGDEDNPSSMKSQSVR